MANLSTGTWSSTAAACTANGGAVTTNTVDYVIPNGVTVTIAAGVTVVCQSLTVASGGVLVFSASTSILNIGGSSPGASNVALSVSSGATITLTGAGQIGFVSSSATQQTIDTGGKTFGPFTFSNVGSYILASSLTLNGLLTVSRGTFNTGNFAMSVGSMSVSSGLTRVITLGSSTITLTSNNVVFTGSTSGITMTANTASFVATGTTSVQLACNAMNMNGSSLTLATAGSPIINNGGTWANVTRTGTATRYDELVISGGNLTVTGTFTVTGNSAVNRLLIDTETAGTARTITAAAVALTNVDFTDITAAGAATWSGTSIGDCQGNTGITFTTPVPRYGVAAGNFSDTATWSASSGGTAGASVPLPHDPVFLNGSSGAGTFTMDLARIKSLDCTGFTGTLTESLTSGSVISFYGSITYGSGMTRPTNVNNVSAALVGRGAQTITSAGKALWPITHNSATFVINTFGGTYTLQDAAVFLNRNTNLLAGTLDTNGFTVTFSGANSTAGLNVTGTLARTLTLGTSTLAFTGVNATLTVSGSNATVNASNSTITYGVSASARTFTGAGFTYGTLNYVVNGSTGSLTIAGSNSFATLGFSDTTNARTLIFTAGVTTTIRTAFNVNGTAGKLMTVTTTSTATAALVFTGTGRVVCAYLNIVHSAASPGSTWYAGTTSTNDPTATANSGWVFTDPPAAFTPIIVLL